ncbi:MAG: HAD-IA family hydrolase [Nanoarchaeota archaeon]|nr:HAD-IA family hydrolase [Nanoarchaeota archaeon]MBU1704182.1 HAD-IA family hydrolase [Nanoarchaeota archaeon]
MIEVAIAMQGLIFDADGVIIDMPHEDIWRQVLQEQGVKHFTTQEYDELASGIPRRQSVINLLKHFGIAFDEELVERLYHRKQEITDNYIDSGAIKFYESTIDFMFEAYGAVPLGLGSSSHNAGKILMKKIVKGASVYDLFNYAISGNVHPGKPDPKIYLLVAEGMSVDPQGCIVFEDSVSGVRSAKGAGMYCVGLDRTGIQDKLLSAGADLVVADINMINLKNLEAYVK